MAGPSTKAIGQALVLYLQSIQYNSAPLYTLAKWGSIIDPTDVVNYVSVTFEEGYTRRYTNTGWKMDDAPIFLIESGFPYSGPAVTADSTTTENLLTDARDLLIPLFAATVSLGGTPNVGGPVAGVYDVTLSDMPDKALYKLYPNGSIYRVHQLFVKAHQQYNVTVGA